MLNKLPTLSVIICAVIALALMIVMTIFNPNEGTDVHTELTMRVFGLLVLGGIFSSIAMIIPGISGSFLILVIGLYRTVLQAISELNIPLLVPFALGVIGGLLGGAALIRYLLAKAPRQTYGAVLGLVVGSVIVLFPGDFGEGAAIIEKLRYLLFRDDSGVRIVFSITTLIVGFTLSYLLGSKKIFIKEERLLEE